MHNLVSILGNLGQDPKVQYGPNGTPYCSFSIAFKCKSKNSQTGHYKTGWVRVTTFAKLAEICSQRLVKGSKVLVSGTLDYHVYEKQDGTTGNNVTIIADNIEFLNRKKEDNENQIEADKETTQSAAVNE